MAGNVRIVKIVQTMKLAQECLKPLVQQMVGHQEFIRHLVFRIVLQQPLELPIGNIGQFERFINCSQCADATHPLVF